jgi:hypothetical protein
MFLFDYGKRLVNRVPIGPRVVLWAEFKMQQGRRGASSFPAAIHRDG